MKAYVIVLLLGGLLLIGASLLLADTWAPGQPGCYLPYCDPNGFPTSSLHQLTETPTRTPPPTFTITPTYIRPTIFYPSYSITSTWTPSPTPTIVPTVAAASQGDKTAPSLPPQARARGHDKPQNGKAKGKSK